MNHTCEAGEGHPARSVNAGTALADPCHTPREVDAVRVEAEASRGRRASLMDRLRFGLVAAYLLLVFAFFVVTRRIQVVMSWRQVARRLFRCVSRNGPLTDIKHQSGLCYYATIDPGLFSDAESCSHVRVFEDGTPLACPRAAHDEIRRQGGGKYSHWAGVIYFSTSDNSDPRANGRAYTFKEV